MEYLYRLVDLINNYDGSQAIENQMRDLICFLSEKEEYRNDELYRTVIFEASEKLRVFGYVKGVNRISIDEFSNNGAYDIKQQAIQNYYSSKVFQNNILDKQQKKIVDLFMRLDKKRLLVSAPTSFGKTFILRELIFLNQERYKNILLIFPTIALLNENTDSIKALVDAINADYKIINNVYSSINQNDNHIFILTPERVLKLLSDQENINIDFFFFDEVYKIDEDFSTDEDSVEKSKENPKADNGNRAKAFRITLYLLSKRIEDFYLAGPYLNLDNAQEGFKRYIEENNITDIQVDFEPTMRIEIDAWKKYASEKHPILGEQVIELYQKGSPTTVEKIVGIMNYLNDNDLDQSIFYCSTPANSMDYVKNVINYIPSRKNKLKRNMVFIEHLKQKYGFHITDVANNTAEYWSLVRALENGYGIHHGKFPKYIQNEILKMFNRKDFNHLFCTSTIIEGVNTTAKNVVIINNSVGNSTMSAFALKNIKGRAGRYYHHYAGRIFYTDRKQREIEKTIELQLDFQTYGDMAILDVDLDNAVLNDLSPSNQRNKALRDEKLHFDFLPDEVFIKNRLYARDIQEKYLSFILQPAEFAKFSSLLDGSNNIRHFLDKRMMNVILDSFATCNILDKYKANIYHAVVSKYSIEGTRGVIEYHVERHLKNRKSENKNPLETIDRAYIQAFDQIRNIVEYEIPKLLCFFEAIFSFAGTLNGHDMSAFNMSTIIRFFELGIITEFGLFLVEYGFPIDTIRTLEENFQSLGSLSLLEAIKYLRENHKKVIGYLDEYELELFRMAIKSVEQ